MIIKSQENWQIALLEAEGYSEKALTSTPVTVRFSTRKRASKMEHRCGADHRQADRPRVQPAMANMAGVPRASLVVIAATLSTFNIPEAGLLFIMGVDQ
jgi:hypothetical protein